MSPKKQILIGRPSLPPQLESVDRLFENWFLDYASYVILERAIPSLIDGLKPVQRRILHTMWEMDDGRFHKVANIIGQTMKYHPHGDAAIGEALVNLGQKSLLIDTQGNWGDVRTGDTAAAPRYIEARLSKFAKEVLFQPNATTWQLSYDGRNREPVTLPVKFPLSLLLGADGIAVGMATKILPHNFVELVDASIHCLKGEPFQLLPDFPTAGMADCSNYQDGKRGGKIKVRAKIEPLDHKTLVIKEIPYGTTTESLIETILKANENGKIKIKRVSDNTAQYVAIHIELPSETTPEQIIPALYAFTDCEVTLAPNCCVIAQDKPQFLSVTEILQQSTENTKRILERELQLLLSALQQQFHALEMEKVFITEKLYLKIEECKSWEEVLEKLARAFQAKASLIEGPITQDDLVKLTEIPIKRISKYSVEATDKKLKELKKQIKETKADLKDIVNYAIRYFTQLKEKYGPGQERRTKVDVMWQEIQASQVARANVKFYVNREDGFIGYGLKKDELVLECSDIDSVIVFRKDGKCLVTKVAEKTFVGKDIMFVGVWRKNDTTTDYNMIYRDPNDKNITRCKRFNVDAATYEREYDMTQGGEVLYISATLNTQPDCLLLRLDPKCKAKSKTKEINFADVMVKGRDSQGKIAAAYRTVRVESLRDPETVTNGTNIRKANGNGTNGKGNGNSNGSNGKINGNGTNVQKNDEKQPAARKIITKQATLDLFKTDPILPEEPKKIQNEYGSEWSPT